MNVYERRLDVLDAFGSLSHEDSQVRATVREFAKRELLHFLPEWYENGTLPIRELASRLGEVGVLGMHLQGYGCAGTSATAYGLACMELEAADSGLRSLVSVQGSLAMYAIWKYGTEEHRAEWLPPMAAGQAIGCFGLTEPDFGSNPSGMRTFARQEGTDWVINGSKMWITNGSAADVAIVWAQTDTGIRGFAVPTDTAGFAALEIKRKLSLRASITSELVLDDVRLPARALLPESHGLAGPLGCLNEARFGIVFGALGAARDALETTIAYCASREVFGRTLSSHQLTQAKLADMAVELNKGYLLALRIAQLKDEGRVTPEQISLGKLNNVREALSIARQCRTLLGAAGITLDHSVMRHMSNLESVLTYEGTSEIHQLTIGRHLTGIGAYR